MPADEPLDVILVLADQIPEGASPEELRGYYAETLERFLRYMHGTVIETRPASEAYGVCHVSAR